MLRDARLYNSRRRISNRDSVTFLETFVKRMDWTRQEQDVVMDVGCGPGGSCHELYIPAFPRMKKMIGVDVMESMIEFANENNTDERVEFHLADIENKQTVEKWFQQITKVVSVYCLHWIKSMEKGVSNIYHLLKPGGEAALLFVLSCRFWDSYELLYSNPKWNKYVKSAYSWVPESHFKKYATGYFCSLFENIGFKVILTEYEERTYTYMDDNECKESMYVLCAFSSHIPDELKNDFKDELLKLFLAYNGRNSEGKPVFRYTTLTVLLKKPILSVQ